MWQWIVEKWNLLRNNVVELNHSAGDDNIEVFQAKTVNVVK